MGVCVFGFAFAAGGQCHRSVDPILHWIVHRFLVLVWLTEKARARSLCVKAEHKDPIKAHEPFCRGNPYR